MTSWAREGAFGLGVHEGEGTAAAEAAAVTLLWLCASTNRRVRDDATKGVVAILDAAPAIAMVLHERFCDVNDPYVVQRLYAALAGCAMRTARPCADLAGLAYAVLARAQGPGLPVDILARDYARTIAERALALGAIGADADLAAVRPPYGASPPDISDADTGLFSEYEWKPQIEGAATEDSPRALLHLHSSLGPHGDFSRYIVGTNSRGDWLLARLGDGAPLTPGERRKAFVASLSRTQIRLHKGMLAARRTATHEVLSILCGALNVADDAADPSGQTGGDASDDAGPVHQSAAQDLASEPERRFVASLSDRQQREFEALNGARAETDRFDLTRATQWMFRRVLEMGYGGAEVYAFDERVAREAWEGGEGRQPATIERIGKKYQWIAYFEFLARMADNYYLVSWMSDSPAVRYDVPPQLRIRDIDPSLLVGETRQPSFGPHLQSWWAGPDYADWQEHVGVGAWMRDARNLPDPSGALVVTDPDGQEWFCLNTHLSWREREVLLQERYDVPRRELWYLIFGYLVPKSEASRAYRWLRRQNFSGRRLQPEARDTDQLYWGELFWSPSFALQSATLAVPPDALKDVNHKSTERLLIPATGAYMHERSNDNSVVDTIRIGFPIAEIVHGVGGVASAPERGAWLDASGRTVCLDPSVVEEGPGAVLVRRDRLEAFLRDSPFALVWTLLSEKQVIGGDTFRTYHGRLVTSGAYWLREAADRTLSLEGGSTPRFEE